MSFNHKKKKNMNSKKKAHGENIKNISKDYKKINKYMSIKY